MYRKPYKITAQYIAPQKSLTFLAGLLGNCRWRWVKNYFIKSFIKKFAVDLSIAELEDLDAYPTFNSFFTRALKTAVRPIDQDENAIVSPADGTISQIGNIDEQKILQAKGFDFSLAALLANNLTLAQQFEHGKFATIYLSPKDYHRVHMPFAGTLKETIYVPGKLFSVNKLTSEHVPNLFARNERLICIFETSIGPMAVILVGAMLVGGIEMIWGKIKRTKKISQQTFTNIHLEKGALLGQFHMGSTVIMLFKNENLYWDRQLQHDSVVQMGSAFAHVLHS